jgi:hypothetical protein
MVCSEAWLRHAKTDPRYQVRLVTDDDIGLKVLCEPAEAAQIIECVLYLRCSLSKPILRLR